MNAADRCRVQIGARYTGPQLDRPVLRRLPMGWTLEEARKPLPFRMNPDRWVGALCALIGVFAIVQTIKQFL